MRGRQERVRRIGRTDLHVQLQVKVHQILVGGCDAPSADLRVQRRQHRSHHIRVRGGDVLQFKRVRCEVKERRRERRPVEPRERVPVRNELVVALPIDLLAQRERARARHVGVVLEHRVPRVWARVAGLPQAERRREADTPGVARHRAAGDVDERGQEVDVACHVQEEAACVREARDVEARDDEGHAGARVIERVLQRGGGSL